MPAEFQLRSCRPAPTHSVSGACLISAATSLEQVCCLKRKLRCLVSGHVRSEVLQSNVCVAVIGLEVKPFVIIKGFQA